MDIKICRAHGSKGRRYTEAEWVFQQTTEQCCEKTALGPGGFLSVGLMTFGRQPSSHVRNTSQNLISNTDTVEEVTVALAACGCTSHFLISAHVTLPLFLLPMFPSLWFTLCQKWTWSNELPLTYVNVMLPNKHHPHTNGPTTVIFLRDALSYSRLLKAST